MLYKKLSVKTSFCYSRAGCGGEEVRRIAAFPPHPLRTRFSQRAVKRPRASVSEPHSVRDCPTMLHHYAKSLARESGAGLIDWSGSRIIVAATLPILTTRKALLRA